MFVSYKLKSIASKEKHFMIYYTQKCEHQKTVTCMFYCKKVFQRKCLPLLLYSISSRTRSYGPGSRLRTGLTFICPCITNIFPNYNQQDATFLDLFIPTYALHVSGGSCAHHQEHITVHTASGTVNQYCC